MYRKNAGKLIARYYTGSNERKYLTTDLYHQADMNPLSGRTYKQIQWPEKNAHKQKQEKLSSMSDKIMYMPDRTMK